MSRALDGEIVASLANGNSQAAYRAIADALDPGKTDGLLEIEILRGSYQFESGTYILQDGAAIAVSKTGLVQAYFAALQVLKSYLESDGRNQLSITTSADELFPATAVILLMDPEHLTAANTRKRLLKAAMDREGPDSPRFQELVGLEKRFVDSLLTSRLHRHTKSPTLWSHRRWLVPFYVRFDLLDVEKDLQGVVMIAAERHPRNYYAWHHARLLATLLDEDAHATRQRLLPVVLDWCTRHHDDISGWSFLLALVSKDGWFEAKTVMAVVEDVQNLARSMRWTNESVWWFLRTVAAFSRVEGSGEDFQEAAKFFTASNSTDIYGDESGRRVLDAAVSWYTANCKTTKEA